MTEFDKWMLPLCLVWPLLMFMALLGSYAFVKPYAKPESEWNWMDRIENEYKLEKQRLLDAERRPIEQRWWRTGFHVFKRKPAATD